MVLSEIIAGFLRRHGFLLKRYPLRHLFRQLDCGVVLDVGANAGQYAKELRSECGYGGRIVSFEPMAAAFRALTQAARSDPLWSVHHYGLGSSPGSRTIHIAGNSASSSLLEMLPAHVDGAPQSAFVGEEQVVIKRLDDVFDELCGADDRVMLKVDTQGFELDVLNGAQESLPRVAALELEMSLIPLYEGAPLAEQLVGMLRAAGFVPYWLTQGFRNPRTQQLLQVDGVFVRPELLTGAPS